ncbi:MAG: PA2778 family cysteine peptidase [Marinobacter sp.]|nr:PA2778 family cysteine peptidase [Marinobacter sp.]
MPFHPQEQYQCGPASLAMMLNAQGVSAAPDELIDRVYLPERQGALQVEMVAAARQYGMLVYPLDPDLTSVLTEVSAGHPVLVLQNLRFNWWPQWHFAVVIGFDSAQEALILHTGTEKGYRQKVSVFHGDLGSLRPVGPNNSAARPNSGNGTAVALPDGRA